MGICGSRAESPTTALWSTILALTALDLLRTVPPARASRQESDVKSIADFTQSLNSFTCLLVVPHMWHEKGNPSASIPC